jgi:hypothetical protein
MWSAMKADGFEAGRDYVYQSLLVHPRTTEVAVCPSLELIYTKAMAAPDSMRRLNQKDYIQNKPI